MTQAQQRQLTRAEAIAERDALTVVKGRNRRNGSPVYGVRSRTDGHYYLLSIEAGRIQCQCAAHQLGGRICAHAAAVRAQLKAERAEADRVAAHELAADEGYSEWAAWLETRGW